MAEFEEFVCVCVCVCACVRARARECVRVSALCLCFSPSHCQYMREQDSRQSHSGHTPSTEAIHSRHRAQLKPDSYFSDEDASD